MVFLGQRAITARRSGRKGKAVKKMNTGQLGRSVTDGPTGSYDHKKNVQYRSCLLPRIFSPSQIYVLWSISIIIISQMSWPMRCLVVWNLLVTEAYLLYIIAVTLPYSDLESDEEVVESESEQEQIQSKTVRGKSTKSKPPSPEPTSQLPFTFNGMHYHGEKL